MFKIINRNAFTFIELLMVIIVIGILATIAVGNFYHTLEKSKGAKVKAALNSIRQAQITYRAINDEFATAFSDLDEVDFSEAEVITADNDWTYTIDSADASTFGVTADRTAGPYQTSTITIDQDGNYTNVGGVADWN